MNLKYIDHIVITTQDLAKIGTYLEQTKKLNFFLFDLLTF